MGIRRPAPLSQGILGGYSHLHIGDILEAASGGPRCGQNAGSNNNVLDHNVIPVWAL
jgi:hypothetical protein